MARTPVSIGTPNGKNGHLDVDLAETKSTVARPIGRWQTRFTYNPAKGVEESDFLVPSSDYQKRFHVLESRGPTGGKVQPGFSGVLMEPVRESRRWRPVRIEGYRDLKAFFETQRGHHKRFLERGDDIDGFQDPIGNTGLIDTEFIPIMGGPFYKQLYIYDYLYMHARAFNLVNHNALAAAAVKILTRFTLGRGVSFHIRHPKARVVWNDFWERNRMREKLRQMARDLTWQGELLLKYLDDRNGFMTLRVLDASTCWEVVTDPEDIEHVYYYHFQYPTPYQVWVNAQIPVSKYIVQQVPPTNIQHIKINVSSMEKRGRSDLFPSMPWLKRFDDYYNGMTLKAVLEANLVWKIKVKGDQADVDAFQTNPQLTELPPPGGVWIENESVELEAMNAEFPGARGAGGIGGQIAAIVATSMNLPAEYFNIEGAGGAARATALVRTDPAVKTIEDRQQLLREATEEMYDRVMSAALLAGRIPREAARHDPDLRPEEPEEPVRAFVRKQPVPINPPVTRDGPPPEAPPRRQPMPVQARMVTDRDIDRALAQRGDED